MNEKNGFKLFWPCPTFSSTLFILFIVVSLGQHHNHPSIGRQARTGFNIKVQGFYALQLDVGECLSIHKTTEGGRKERRTKNVLPLLCLGDLLFNLYGRGIRSGTATKFPMFSGWLAG